MSVKELQSAVSQLSAEELDHFWRWFEEFMADQWDRQIEADILAGRLDPDRKSTRLNSSHIQKSRMPSSA